MSSSSPFPTDAGLRKPICVFCGSSPGSKALFARAAEAVSAALAKENHPVVYGGGRRGIMGVVSKATLEAGGYVHGIIPQALVTRASERTELPGSDVQAVPEAKSKEGAGDDLLSDDYGGRLTMELVDSMHDRKLKMAQLSTGGFVVLPGGYGTYEEMMEMITWNQLGIHRLPIIVLNIGNMYSPIKDLLKNAVEAGFIAEKNLALVQIVDLEDAAANDDESRAGEWGAATVKALKDWSLEENAGYGFKWMSKGDIEAQVKSDARPTRDEKFSLFTTMRFVAPSAHTIVTKEAVPLLDAHIARLRTAHAYYAQRDGQSEWGQYPGDGAIWAEIRKTLEDHERTGPGDWRIRVLLHRGARVEVQAVPAPRGAGPFRFRPEPESSETRRPVVLDSAPCDPHMESDTDRWFRLYKTTERGVYDEASKRGETLMPGVDHPEVLLRTSTHLLETVTSNIAIHSPREGEPDWATPRLHPKERPFLDGVMRQYLLAEGVIREEDLTVDDWEKAKREGRRVIGFNGLRGVWEAEPR